MAAAGWGINQVLLYAGRAPTSAKEGFLAAAWLFSQGDGCITFGGRAVLAVLCRARQLQPVNNKCWPGPVPLRLSSSATSGHEVKLSPTFMPAHCF